jgi:Tat protein secretion system quality control protein TatD with DNase activity
MKIIDSHCHLDRVDLSAFGGNMESLLAHAKTLSVEEFLCVCIDLEHFDDVFSLARQYPQIYASVGVHPCELEGKKYFLFVYSNRYKWRFFQYHKKFDFRELNGFFCA